MEEIEFKNKLKKYQLNIKQFSEITGMSYSTVAKFGKQNPVPSWVDSWFNLYDYKYHNNENVVLDKIEELKKLIIEIKEK